MSDYKERMQGREFDKMIKEKFAKYGEKVEAYLNKQEEVKMNVTPDITSKLEKLIKISDKLGAATKAHLSAIGASAEDIKQKTEQVRRLHSLSLSLTVINLSRLDSCFSTSNNTRRAASHFQE